MATTGAWPTKANNPNVPMTPEEISEDVYACWKAGAAIAHLHMRDDEGHGTMDKEKFRKTVELLRANHPDCDIILNMTTSGDIHADDTTRQIDLVGVHHGGDALGDDELGHIPQLRQSGADPARRWLPQSPRRTGRGRRAPPGRFPCERSLL